VVKLDTLKLTGKKDKETKNKDRFNLGDHGTIYLDRGLVDGKTVEVIVKF